MPTALAPEGAPFPPEIWEVLCAKVLAIFRQRDPAGAQALDAVLSAALATLGQRYQRGEVTFAEVAEKLKKLRLPRAVRPRRTLERPLADVETSMQQLVRIVRALRAGKASDEDTMSRVAQWWDRRGDILGLRRTFPRRAFLERLHSRERGPLELARFLVAQRHALSEAAVRKYLLRASAARRQL
jgi:hypothetical protein